jgi:Uma2 family endonuclease
MFMADPARRRATYEDVLRAPRDRVAEIVDGELHVHPRPAGPHTAAASALGEELGPPFKRGRGGPGGWIILDEPELHLGADVLVPDLGGWRRENMPALPDAAFIELVPDWVCEILSPSTARLDRVRKMPLYARSGVRHFWLIDPAARTLEVLRNDAGRWVVSGVYGGDDNVRAEPFDEVEIALARWWG